MHVVAQLGRAPLVMGIVGKIMNPRVVGARLPFLYKLRGKFRD